MAYQTKEDDFIQTIGIQAFLLLKNNRKTHLVGTVRENRKGLSIAVIEKKLKKRMIFAQQNKNIQMAR